MVKRKPGTVCNKDYTGMLNELFPKLFMFYISNDFKN